MEYDFKENLYGHIYVIISNKDRDIHKNGIVKNGRAVKSRLKSYMTGKTHPDIEFLMKISNPL